MAYSSPSVLIIRLDGIGDALALAPLVEALRARAIPTDLILRTQNHDTYSALAVRRVYNAPFALRSSARENLARIARFGEELKRNEYSHVLVATEDPGGYRLARAVAVPASIGFDNGWGKPLKTLWVRSLLTRTLRRSAGLDTRARHECATLFELGRTLVGTAHPTRSASRLRPLILDSEPTPDLRVAIQLTDKWARLGIPFDDVAALVEDVHATYGVRALASATEAEYAAQVADRTGVGVEMFEELPLWKSAIGSASALIAPDCGAIHLAGMLGTPTVAIFPPTRDFALQTARWSPWAAPYRIVKADGGWPSHACNALGELQAATLR